MFSSLKTQLKFKFLMHLSVLVGISFTVASCSNPMDGNFGLASEPSESQGIKVVRKYFTFFESGDYVSASKLLGIRTSKQSQLIPPHQGTANETLFDWTEVLRERNLSLDSIQGVNVVSDNYQEVRVLLKSDTYGPGKLLAKISTFRAEDGTWKLESIDFLGEAPKGKSTA